MMRNKLTVIIVIIALGLLGLGVYSLNKLPRTWSAKSNSEVMYGKKIMLAAERFLSESQKVKQFDSMPEALHQPLPPGTMLLTSNEGFLLPGQIDTVLQWVRAGNTLVMMPGNPAEIWGKRKKADKAGEDDGDADEADPTPDDAAAESSASQDEDGAPEDSAENAAEENTVDQAKAASAAAAAREATAARAAKTNPSRQLERDPFGKLIQVQQRYHAERSCKPGKCAAVALQLAHLSYPLMLKPRSVILAGPGRPTQLVAQDEAGGTALRIYREGRGHIVAMAQNYFTNQELLQQDHAELLLQLTRLNPQGSHTVIIRNLDYLPWYQALWDHAKLPLLSLGGCLMLLLWRGLRRFGNLLPEPVQIRRALIEHIDASARWLWHLPAGPTMLLNAARANTSAILLRRIPEWGRLSPQEQVKRLEGEVRLNPQQLWHALHEKAATQPLAFTSQIQSLQTLRRQYERK